jgi:hypothetical protein
MQFDPCSANYLLVLLKSGTSGLWDTAAEPMAEVFTFAKQVCSWHAF